MTKMTKKEMFATVIATIETLEIKNKAEMLEFLKHEIELLNRKSSKSAPTKTQKENEILLTQLEEALAEMTEPVTISEFMEKSTHPVSTLTNQKLSALLKKLIDAGKVVRTTEKKKAYFALIK